MRPRIARIFLPLHLLASAALAQEPAVAPQEARPNVLLITLDTMRADAIAPWGAGGVTPNLDALAAESIVAMDAHAPAPLTFPSHSSMMTGLYPFAHGVRDNDLYRLDPSARTAARMLAEAGYRTEAIIAASVLRASTGMSNGFEVYSDLPFRRSRNSVLNEERTADEVSNLLLERLAVQDARPWFFWVHYFDTHVSYRAPGGPPETATLKEQYEAEARFLDAELGRALKQLRESGALAHAWVVVCGDHGEGLGLQQEMSHAYLAEEGTLRVPLFVRRPDGALRGRLAAPTTTADVYPTLLSIAGLAPPYAIHGRDLVAAFELERRGGAEADLLAERAVWFESWAGWHIYKWARLEGVLVGRFKYVRSVADELFDVTDPTAPELETTNLAASRPDVLRALKLRYASLPQEPVHHLESAVPTLPPEEVARLQELGYVARMIGDDDPTKNGTLDPRVHYKSSVDARWALRKAEEGDFVEAIRVLDMLARAYPGCALFREDLGKVMVRANRKAEATRVFASALEIDPDLVTSNFLLGQLMRESGQFDLALRFLDKAIELSPVHLEAWTQRRAVHGAQKNYAAVLQETVEVVKLAGLVGDEDGDQIAQNCLDEWLPNVLNRLKGDPRRNALAEQALNALPEGSTSRFVAGAREILKGAIASE